MKLLCRERPQILIVKYTGLNDPLPYTHRLPTLNLSPTELASALIEDLRSCESTNDMTILESGPAFLGGSPGCKVIVRFQNRELANTDSVEKLTLAPVVDACTPPQHTRSQREIRHKPGCLDSASGNKYFDTGCLIERFYLFTRRVLSFFNIF